MLFAAWRRTGAPLPQARWARRAQSLVEAPCGVVAVSAPFRLERRTDWAVAWLYPGTAPISQFEARGPDVRLSEDALTLTSGWVPQFPLYYYRSEDVLAVSSELELLVDAFPSRVNTRRAIGIAAGLLDPLPGNTAFTKHRRLLGGETIIVGPNGMEHRTHLPHLGSGYSRAPMDELVAELRAQLRGAVRRAIGDARHVAVFAGGGLDSSGILALAAAECREEKRELDPIAEVWASPGDDRPHLSALERSLGIVAHRIRAADAGGWVAASLCADAQPQLFGAACLDMHLWSTAKERHDEVALAGHAGDDILGGAISFVPLLRQWKPLQAILSALRFRTEERLTRRKRLGRWLLRPLVQPYLPKFVRTRARRHFNWMTPRARRELTECLEPSTSALPESPDDWMQYWACDGFLGELAVSWGQVAAVTGYAPIDVFRDPELLRFVAQIHPLDLSVDSISRGLYRRAMKGLIPETIRNRMDKSLGQPGVAAAAISSNSIGELRELGSLTAMADAGLADPAAFRPSLQRWLALMQRGERTDPDPLDESWHQVWQLLSVEAFLRKYGG